MTTADWSHRLAGALVIVVGVLNLALGVLSLISDALLLSTGVAGGLVTAGLVTAAAGALVWRGSWVATTATLTIFAMLLIFQLSELVADDGATDGDVVGQHLARFAVLLVLVLSLGVAAWRLRRHRSTAGR